MSSPGAGTERALGAAFKPLVRRDGERHVEMPAGSRRQCGARDPARQRVGRNRVAVPFRAVGGNGLDLDRGGGAEDGRRVVDTHRTGWCGGAEADQRDAARNRCSGHRGAAGFGDPENRLARMFMWHALVGAGLVVGENALVGNRLGPSAQLVTLFAG